MNRMASEIKAKVVPLTMEDYLAAEWED